MIIPERGEEDINADINNSIAPTGAGSFVGNYRSKEVTSFVNQSTAGFKDEQRQFILLEIAVEQSCGNGFGKIIERRVGIGTRKV